MLGDQLNRRIGALGAAQPGEARVLLVESATKLRSKRFHRQRLHVVLASMRNLAAELRHEGFEVDHRRSSSLAEGLAEHRAAYRPGSVRASEPLSWDAERLITGLDVQLVPSDQFLCHRDDFARWADAQGAKRLVMENFYRWQRRRLGYLMDGDEPAGGRWNLDAENREPPPKGGRGPWPAPMTWPIDDIDRAVVADLPPTAFGRGPGPATRLWPTSRGEALDRLRHVVDEVLPHFGPHEDAILQEDWHLAHTLLSSSLNLGLLLPEEVCDAVEAAYRNGAVPLNSAEGLVRQIIGWREYVWGLYWRWMPAFRTRNELEATRPLPPAFTGQAPTAMRCVATALDGVEQRGWAHHIQRLMVLSNLSMMAGVRPNELVEWMWASFVDGSEWVMVPNVVGMGQHADGGSMATKPYAGGGAYINRMSDHCRRCRYDPRLRTGDDACPFTTLYWDFLDRHRERFAHNPRMVRQIRGLDRLGDLDGVRVRAAEVLDQLDRGQL